LVKYIFSLKSNLQAVLRSVSLSLLLTVRERGRAGVDDDVVRRRFAVEKALLDVCDWSFHDHSI